MDVIDRLRYTPISSASYLATGRRAAMGPNLDRMITDVDQAINIGADNLFSVLDYEPPLLEMRRDQYGSVLGHFELACYKTNLAADEFYHAPRRKLLSLGKTTPNDYTEGLRMLRGILCSIDPKSAMELLISIGHRRVRSFSIFFRKRTQIGCAGAQL